MNLGVAKAGNIGTSTVVELLLDERADREGLNVTVSGSGAKMDADAVEDCVDRMLATEPEAAIFISPNLTVDGPQLAAEKLANADIPAVMVGDGPSEEATGNLAEMGLGYVIVKGDPMIGARREFLDASEMSLFNGHVLEGLSCTGALAAVQEAIDDCLETGELPELVVDRDTAMEHADFDNPYAEAKAMAAHEMLEKAADLDVEGCFMVHDSDAYIPIVAAAHEMVRKAAELAEEAREMEKSNDSVTRRPHASDGSVLGKSKLMEKPT